MSSWPDATLLVQTRDEARHAAAVLRLPFRARAWRGPAGAWAGAARGSSLEFHDHRAYAPGDDPRHIDWNAYARTDAVTLKVYRDEVSPAVDVLVDLSGSMLFLPEKARRTLELMWFAVESSLAAGSALRVILLRGGEARVLAPEAVAGAPAAFPAEFGTPGAPELAAAPRLRAGGLRVAVTDGLTPAAPESWLGFLASARGRGVVLAPWVADEAEPAAFGDVELLDCETGERRLERLDEERRALWRQGWLDHVAALRDCSRRFAIAFAHVPSAPPLRDALAGAALEVGAVEPCD